MLLVAVVKVNVLKEEERLINGLQNAVNILYTKNVFVVII